MTKIRNQEILIEFGRNIKLLRKAQNISQAQLAFEANIPREQVGRIERGQVNTALSTIVALSKALKTHPNNLLKINYGEDFT